MKNIRIFIISSIIFVVIGCGGGGGSDASSNNTNNTNTPQITSGNVQLGAIKSADVIISTLDDTYTIYSTTTENDGTFDIDRELIKSNINNLPIKPLYLKITSSGGVDTDPNDDGIEVVSENIQVEGKVIGIVNSDDLITKNNIYINLISTVFSEMILQSEIINDESINQVLNQLKIDDINNDGILSLDDVVDYQMVEHNSSTEEKLRLQYLGYIHEGKDNLKSKYIESLQDNTSFVTVIKEKYNNGNMGVTLKTLNKNNHIQYSTEEINDTLPLPNTYLNEIVLKQNDLVIYEECNQNNDCFKRERVVNNDKIKNGSYTIPNLPIGYTSKNNIENLRNIYLEKRDLYLKFSIYKEQWKLQLNRTLKENDKLHEELIVIQKKLADLEI